MKNGILYASYASIVIALYGVTSTAPVTTFKIQSTKGSGAGVAGSAISVNGGLSGDVNTAGRGIDFGTARAGSGTTHTSAMTIHPDGVLQYRTSVDSGSGVASMGTNCPAVNAAQPYTWLKMKAPDGTTVYVAAWR